MSPHEAAGLLFMLAGVDVEPARILDDAAVRVRVVECARLNRSELRAVIRRSEKSANRLRGVLATLDRLEEAVETVEAAAEART